MSAPIAGFPNWVMLEPFVFRRDDDESFPDDTKAPIRASGTTSLGAPFRVAFSFTEAPLISRLYAQLPGFPDPREQIPLAILASHRHLALFRVATETSDLETLQDFFIYSADNPSELIGLPHCTVPEMDCTRRRIGRVKQVASSKRHLLTVRSMGLLCQGEGKQEFVVAELKLLKPNRTEVYADIRLLRSDISRLKSAGPVLSGGWDSMRVPILRSHNPDDIWQLCLWQTDTIIPSDRWLCWIDYYRGILLCDVFAQPLPTVSFIRFPLDEFPDTHNRSRECSWLYRGVSAIDAGRVLKFVNVARNDGIGYGALKPGKGFTITCHTLLLDSIVLEKNRLGFMVLKQDMLGSVVWNRDYMFTSDELWSAYPPELPRGILMFPQVNIDRPHVVHFLISEFKYVMKKMWLVAIDMNTRTVESFSQYINGEEDIGTKDADLTKHRSSCPMSFLTCELSKYLHFPR